MRNILCQFLKRKKRSLFIPPTKEVNNQAEEIEYFKAYLLPISQKANLQTALDTYGSVRLEKGDYSGVNITIRSNQRIYGHPSTSRLSSVTIASGSTDVVLESLKGVSVIFQTGAVISNCRLKTLKYCEITASNAMIENSSFVDITHSPIRFDCSLSGYIRNNRIIKHQVQDGSNMLVIKGNSTTPSFGNVNIHSNYLTSSGVTTDVVNLESATFVGIDCETYSGVTRELLYINNVDKVKLLGMHGGYVYDNSFKYANIDASEVFSVSGISSKISPTTNIFNFNNSDPVDRSIGTVTGYYANTVIEEVNRNKSIFLKYDGGNQTVVTDPTIKSKLINSILDTEYTPWARPNLEVVPDPLGSNWRIERVGKPDSTAYIQNLIDTNGVAELPEGVFYISSTLSISVDDNAHGIIGKGTGKTVICGLTDDFPLISVTTGTFGSLDLAYLTLQGGSTGLYVSNHMMMIVYSSLKYVTFKDQIQGVEFYDMVGLDNNFFEYLAFVNCNKGIYSHYGTVTNQIEGSTYWDKNLFYKCQFINSNKSMELISARANNMNAWVDCKFDGGVMAADMGGELTIFANCDFTNFNGDYTLKSSSFNLINCNFYNNNNSKSTLFSVTTIIEGCNFLDDIALGTSGEFNGGTSCIFNSVIKGDAVIASGKYDGVTTFINSSLLSNPTLSKMLVSVTGLSSKEYTSIIHINETSNPYPQFLVTQ